MVVVESRIVVNETVYIVSLKSMETLVEVVLKEFGLKMLNELLTKHARSATIEVGDTK